jgi:hypothetical protein
MIKPSLLRLRLLPALRYTPLIALPLTEKRNSASLGYRYSLGPRQASVLATDPSKATCFNYGEVGHFAGSCLNPRTTLKINEIEQKNEEAFVDDEANNDEDDADSESEN